MVLKFDPVIAEKMSGKLMATTARDTQKWADWMALASSGLPDLNSLLRELPF